MSFDYKTYFLSDLSKHFETCPACEYNQASVANGFLFPFSKITCTITVKFYFIIFGNGIICIHCTRVHVLYFIFWIGILFLLSYFYFKLLYSGFARENHCCIYISVHYCVMFIHYHVGFFIAFCFIFSVFWFSMCLSFLCCSRSPQKKPFSVQGYHDTRTTKYELQLSPSNLQMLCLL